MYQYNGIKINYKDIGNKNGNPIVYLHGWGQNISLMEPIANPFLNTNRIILIDLPGFGKSDEPDFPWTLDNYVEMLSNFLKFLKIEKPNLVGHSFGGKICLLYASKYNVNRLLVLASPFKVRQKQISLKIKILKKLENIPGIGKLASLIKRHMGSTDYKNATPLMRNVMVKHVNTDITEDIKKIKCPTFIIWGNKDDAVPVEDAYELKNLIKDSGLVVYDNCTHYAYLERLNQTCAIILSFMS